MRLPKEVLAELLSLRDVADEARKDVPATTITVKPYIGPCFNGGECTNPQMDCVNCPRRGTTHGFTTITVNKIIK